MGCAWLKQQAATRRLIARNDNSGGRSAEIIQHKALKPSFRCLDVRS